MVEDGFPFVEEELKKICYDLGIHATILGKQSGHLPLEGEIYLDIVAMGLAKVLGIDYKLPEIRVGVACFFLAAS